MPLLLVAFIVVPLVELSILLQVGQALGALPTIGLLVLGSVLGAALLRSQGRSAWRRFTGAVQEGRVPAREVADGALVIVGGTLLLTPGFATDLFGVLLLLPPTRAVVRRLLLRRVAGRAVRAAAGGARRRAPSRGHRPRPGDVVDGVAVDLDGPARLDVPRR